MQAVARSFSQKLLSKFSRQSPQKQGRRGFKTLIGVHRKKEDDCKHLEEEAKSGITCRKPDLRAKPIPPYRYGYCREEDTPMLMSCPPRVKARGKGPCCHDQVEQKKGGCRTNK